MNFSAARSLPRLLASGLSCFVLCASAAAAFYDQHVFFSNALATGPYPHTSTYSIAPSELVTTQGNIEVSSDQFHSPPNALKIQWKSAPGGDWQVRLRAPNIDWRQFAMIGDTLSFWIYSEDEIDELGAPRIYLIDKDGRGSQSLPLVKGAEKIPAKQWTRIKLPLGTTEGMYRGTSDSSFHPSNSVGFTWVQGLDDGKKHTVYLDDVMLVKGTGDDLTPPGAPTQLTARGYERHVDLGWQKSPGENVALYRIYRSSDGKEFKAVSSQRGDWARFEDFLEGAPGKTAYYQVTAVDLDGNESARSNIVSATTKEMTDDELMDMVQLGCFRYYWEASHPNSGMSPELIPGDENLMALGGNGFGIMALLVAAERGFVTRDQAVERLTKILAFLDKAERYKGIWAHFLDARDSKTIAYFGKYDNGGDLVETSFVMQGLLAARQYFNRDNAAEAAIRKLSTKFWEEAQWDWYRKTPDSPLLYWHWSPDHAFHISHPLIGWNETAIIYLLAIASPTHGVPASLWHTGWAGQSPLHVEYRRNWSRTTDGDHFTNGNTYYGIKLEVGEANGSELFFTHFSFMGFDPRGMRDKYTNYFKNNRAIALIQNAYAIDNPRKFKGYGADSWGRSAGVNNGGGRAIPRDDNGTINIMAALSSMPYTPKESLAALRHFYRELGPKVWGPYGFYDGFNETQNHFEPDYMALNQAPIVVMIENHRTGLVWKNFMANPEIAPALKAIGFQPDPEK